METSEMKEQVEIAPGQWEYRDVPVPVPGDDEVLLKLRVCAIGDGETSPGHGFFGTVEEMGSSVQDFLIGDRVAATVRPDACFAQYVAVPASQCHKLPEEMDDYTAAFVAPLAQILRATVGAKALLAEPCVVRGAHVLRTALAHARGLVPVIAVVNGEGQRQAVLKIGADYAIDASASKDVEKEIASILEGKEPVYMVTGDVVPNDADPKSGWDEAVTLLRYRRVDPKPLFSVAVPLKDLPEAFAELRSGSEVVNVFVDTSLQTRFTFPAYREPMSATIAP